MDNGFVKSLQDLRSYHKQLEIENMGKIADLQVTNDKLRKERDTMLCKLRVVEADHRDQQQLINKLYFSTNHTNYTGSNTNHKEEPPRRPTSHQLELPSVVEPRDRAQEELVAKATANALRRSKVTKPLCWLARSNPDGCTLGDQCKESHDVIPNSFCIEFNNLGVCKRRDCKQTHMIYDYLNPPRDSTSIKAGARKCDEASSEDEFGRRKSPARGRRNLQDYSSPRRDRDSRDNRHGSGKKGRGSPSRSRSRDQDRGEDRYYRGRDRDRDRHWDDEWERSRDDYRGNGRDRQDGGKRRH